MRALHWLRFGSLAATGALAFTCYPEYQFSWCDNSTEASCIHDYAFSVGNFQRKLGDYYLENKRPPLTEAYFLTRLPKPFQMQFPESGCAAPLIMAYLLVAESKLPVDDEAQTYAGVAQSLIDQLPDLVRPILQESKAWPFKEAIARFERTAADSEEARQKFPALLAGPGQQLTLEFVIVHCREDLEWMESMLLPIAPAGSNIAMYEKCGETPALPESLRTKFARIDIRPCSDPVGKPRGDECLGYLAHLVNRYDELATFTVFMQADPHDHMHFPFLKTVLKMVERGTYAVPYLPLNGARHVKTTTPCMNAIHKAIFGEEMLEPVGPYCCAQFVVWNARVRDRPVAFYKNMLELVDGTVEQDLCAPGRVTRSTHCYGMEFTWHLVFGEPYETPLRQDDIRLPTPLRAKFGDEHMKKHWNDVVLNPNTPKKIVERVDYDAVVR
eukprot:TRINITY_DN23466_c0_g1_i1.p1 TRINITY_DN23466_c0_g1~~TRINITY_DN23466_c0_g1_i1.p1  ORF type:complete len:442 (-),score=69.22 TRINITY_DN23466_c0_g1_i1:104-1429(-)